MFSAHSKDIGIECQSLAKLLSNKIYWKGIDFSSSTKPSSLQYVDVSQAYEAIKGSSYLPDLDHVTVKSSVFGVKCENITSSLNISDSIIRDNRFAGIQIKGRSKDVKIKNTSVDNTTNGDGFQYSGIASPVDFCSADNITSSFPIFFQASGNEAETIVDCAKVRNMELVIFELNYSKLWHFVGKCKETAANERVLIDSSKYDSFFFFFFSENYRQAHTRHAYTGDTRYRNKQANSLLNQLVLKLLTLC